MNGLDRKSRLVVPAGACLLALLLAQGLAFIVASSQTSDEAVHLAAGYSYLTTGDFRLNAEHPPLIKEIAALPLLPLGLTFPGAVLWDVVGEWNIGRIFVHENRLRNDTVLFLGRLPILLLSVLLGIGIVCWGRRLYGPRGALLALALYVLDPNVVAHSSLVTTDLGLTLFVFLAIYALWSWSDRPSPGRLALAGLATGGALASKYTSIWLLPILLVIAGALILSEVPLPVRPWTKRSRVATAESPLIHRMLALLAAGAVLAVAAALVLAASYFVVGLPSYLRGLGHGLSHTGDGHLAYLRGQFSENGWWYYFLFAFLIKTPPGTLLALVLAIASMVPGRRLRLQDELFLALPVLMIFAITAVWTVNIGLRHVLPVYPFLCLFAGRLCTPSRATAVAPAGAGGRTAPTRLLAAAALVCVAWNGVEAMRIAPHHLAYFNPFAGGPAKGHRLLLDSNLDWGQAAKDLRRFQVDQNAPALYCAYFSNSDPWYYGVRYQYVPGSGNLESSRRRPDRVPEDAPRDLLAVSAMVLHSVQFTDHTRFDWLLERRPIATPGFAFFVYDITGDADAHARLAALSLGAGRSDLAESEARRALRHDPANRLALAVLEELL